MTDTGSLYDLAGGWDALHRLEDTEMRTDPAFRRAVMEHIELGTRVAQRNSHAQTGEDLHPLREVPLWTLDASGA
jgi:hemoglobin